MKFAVLGCLVGSLLWAGTQDSDLNVNKRYTVDSVVIAGKGWRTNLSDSTDKISNGLRRDMLALVGQKLNTGILEGLGERLKKELNAREVTHHILRADTPDHVQVEFEVKPGGTSLHATLTKLLYSSKQGWNGGGMAGITTHGNTFLVGVTSDGDTLNERFAGVNARYQNDHVGASRVGVRLDVENYHTQWDRQTLDALSSAPEVTGEAYRTRQNFQPVVSIELAKPLTMEVGATIERFGYATASQANNNSHALLASLRYHRRFSQSEELQDLDATYTLRAASRALGSDFVFVSHTAGLHYKVVYGKHKLSDRVTVGGIWGRAPLSDRYVAGNSYYLRGWNKFDIDPIGGNRIAHNTVDYRYGPFQAFYDAGSVWESGQPVVVRHSVGVGVRESVFTLAVAFPVRSGRVEPIFMMGMIY